MTEDGSTDLKTILLGLETNVNYDCQNKTTEKYKHLNEIQICLFLYFI